MMLLISQKQVLW